MGFHVEENSRAPMPVGNILTCRHNCVTTEISAELSKGFDTELGLTYLELSPDGGRAQLDIHDKLLQPWGLVHGGVYCSVVECLASVRATLGWAKTAADRRRGQQQHRFPARHLVRALLTAVSTPDPPRTPPAAVAAFTSPTTTTDSFQGQVRLANITEPTVLGNCRHLDTAKGG